MTSDRPRFPSSTDHIAIAGRTGSGKTVAALAMLAQRDMDEMAWIIVDHKGDDTIAKLPAERLNLGSRWLPRSGLYVVRPPMTPAGRQQLEDLLLAAFQRGRTGIYIDEGHLVGQSQAVRTIMVAGRSKRVPMMWTSQRAAWIDTFIWSQASFYRVFQLQTVHDVKRFEENFPIPWKSPPPFHSYYFDVSKGRTYLLKPAPPIEETVKRLEEKTRLVYKAI